ncbi:hypothetical protein CPB86DRAFT_790063 [Serendipita vermifera]|nr:hypothetical protein CPB86DRAFT_790063 [Serendipita vermifera]
MSIHLVFSNNSVRNTAITCDSLGIHYEVSEKHGVVSVARWDRNINRHVTVGQFRLPFFSKDKIRLSDDPEWRPLKLVLYKREDKFWTSARSFQGNNGAVYRWKARWSDGLVMCHDNKEKGNEPLVKYVRHVRVKKNPSYLEVTDSSVLDSLDTIITTFLIMERKKRDSERESGGGD